MSEPTFRHEALLYEGAQEFLAGAVEFVRAGLEQDAAILVALRTDKADLLRAALGDDAAGVRFNDMATHGGNPARLIPMWREFADAHRASGRPVRAVGEPVWPGRSAAELAECEHHEGLLNLTYGGGHDWALLCPYDVAALPPEALAVARRTHPVVHELGATGASGAYAPPSPAGLSTDPLPEPDSEPTGLDFSAGDDLAGLRSFVAERAADAGLGDGRVTDLVLAVNELVTNSLRHAGGRGTLRIWREPDALLCEIADQGRIADPLVGRHVVAPGEPGGRGLWLVNHVCDLVQLRARPTGTLVRVHMRFDADAAPA